MAKKRSRNNEKNLEKELQTFFQDLLEEVLDNLDKYWNDYQMLQGQVDLITAPINNHHQDYYHILEKYNKKEYALGKAEGERLVELAMGKHSNKARLPKLRAKWRQNNKDYFGTIPWSEKDLLDRVFVASRRTLARVTKDINQVITEGYTSGKGINVVANMLTKKFNGLSDWEARRIARTEIHNSHNQGVMRIYDELNVEYTQWIAAHDDRTRESHLEIDGEIIQMGGTYSNGLRYPGDTDGDISEWINCRCSNAPFVIPYGYMAPADKERFHETDLVKIGN